MTTIQSDCCNAIVIIGGRGLTHWHICTKCLQPCDFHMPERTQLIKDLKRLVPPNSLESSTYLPRIADFILDNYVKKGDK